jgi:hypothetical protein
MGLAVMFSAFFFLFTDKYLFNEFFVTTLFGKDDEVPRRTIEEKGQIIQEGVCYMLTRCDKKQKK